MLMEKIIASIFSLILIVFGQILLKQEQRSLRLSRDDRQKTRISTKQIIRRIICAYIIIGIGIMIYGLVAKEWYIDEVSMVFLSIGILSGIIAGFDQRKIAETFVKGCKDLVYAAVIIGLAEMSIPNT